MLGALPKARERHLEGSAHGMTAMVRAEGFTLYCGAALLPSLSWPSTELYLIWVGGRIERWCYREDAAVGEFFENFQ